MNTPMIEIKNLTIVYNENTPYEVVALKDFSLKVEKGDTLVITGGNGSGKSTLLNAIAGTVPVKSGKIFINGIDVTNWSAIKRSKFIGTVYQDTMLGTCPNLTIQENFQLTNTKGWWKITPYRLKLTENQKDNIKNTGLPLYEREASKINMLSGGQRQAIAVCLAFENTKPILLFDEFTSSLDNSTLENVLDFTMHQAKDNRITMLLVMHNKIIIQNYKTSLLNL